MASQNAIGSNKPIEVAFGGTGDSTLTIHGVLVGNTTGSVTALTAGTNGQVLVGSTAADPVMATLGAGTGISYTTGAGSLTISSTGGGLSWTDVTGTSQAAVVNSGYTANNAGLVTITLPTTAAYGSVIKIMGKGAGGWRLAQNNGQTVFFGSSTTTAGATGSLSSTLQRDTLEVVCVAADTDWQVSYALGNITVV